MITATISGKEYHIRNLWQEITLGDFIQLTEIDIPERLRELWIADEKAFKKAIRALTREDEIRIHPEYYGSIIRTLSDIPTEIIELMVWDLRTQLFDLYLKHFIISAMTAAPFYMKNGELLPYDAKEIESFMIEKQKYRLLEKLKLYGEDIPLAGEPVITFAESSDIELAWNNLAEKGVERLPMLIAVYCRPEGEKYDEKKTREREPMMRGLTMDKVWRSEERRVGKECRSRWSPYH